LVEHAGKYCSRHRSRQRIVVVGRRRRFARIEQDTTRAVRYARREFRTMPASSLSANVSMAPPQIILLNGASSAGKSSIARALQARLPGLWLHVALDQFLAMMPLKFHGVAEGVRLVPQPDGTLPVQIGPIGYETLHGFHRAVRALAAGGARVIVDDVILNRALLTDWQRELDGLDVFFVGVRCALQELQRREQARGDRGIGQAVWQCDLVHRHMSYDAEIDSTSTTPAVCAEAITIAIEQRPGPVL
jgi:chloramphenicol 3-O phosphotransferase